MSSRLKYLQENNIEELKCNPGNTDEHTAAKIVSLMKATQKSSNYVFRGMHKKNYELKPSISRDRADGEKYNRFDEKIIFNIVRIEGMMYLDRGNLTDIDLLALAQHFGAPTRLLDWSFNPLVALYFATFSRFGIDDSNDGIVYVYKARSAHYVRYVRSSYKLNVTKEDKHFFPEILFRDNDIRFVYPRFTDDRIRNQKGLFSIQKNPRVDFVENCSRGDLKFVIIPKNIKRSIARYLYDIGITHDFIMPGFAGFCETVAYRYMNKVALRRRYLEEKVNYEDLEEDR